MSMSISGMGGLARITAARTRSISAENPDGRVGGGARATRGTGAKAGRDLGKGWKISPSIQLKAGSTTTIAEMTGPGVVQHIWITVHPSQWRNIVLRCYWDGAATPAVATPLGDFFGQGWCEFAQLSSLPIATNAHGGLNSYWEMPFRRSARITLENVGAEETTVYYQVTYSLQDVPDDTAYLHATWRRSNPLPYKAVHPILDGITGAGHYVGTYLAWGSNNKGWWGEGEIKFFLDGDTDYPTICGTGTEDYVGGAWCFQGPGTGYQTYTTPYLGFHQAIKPDGVHHSQTRFGMYRWHVADPVRFARTCASTSRRWAGAPVAATSRCRTTSPPRPSGTRTWQAAPATPPSSTPTRWRSSSAAPLEDPRSGPAEITAPRGSGPPRPESRR